MLASGVVLRISQIILGVTLVAAVSACGNSDTPDSSDTPAEIETVTVTASPTEEVAQEEEDLVDEPDDSDYQAVAIYTLQTETESFAGASDQVVSQLLELTCGAMLFEDGENVNQAGFDMAESALEAAGLSESEYPLAIRAATAFCPEAFDEVSAKYGSEG